MCFVWIDKMVMKFRIKTHCFLWEPFIFLLCYRCCTVKWFFVRSLFVRLSSDGMNLKLFQRALRHHMNCIDCCLHPILLWGAFWKVATTTWSSKSVAYFPQNLFVSFVEMQHLRFIICLVFVPCCRRNSLSFSHTLCNVEPEQHRCGQRKYRYLFPVGSWMIITWAKNVIRLLIGIIRWYLFALFFQLFSVSLYLLWVDSFVMCACVALFVMQ